MSEQDQPPITVALVTGASHGIGLEVARQLAGHGMHAIVTARDEAKAQQAAQGPRRRRPAGHPDGARRRLGRERTHARPAPAGGARAPRRARQQRRRLRRLVGEGLVGRPRRLAGALRGQPLRHVARRAGPPAPARQSPHGRLVNVGSGAGSHGDEDFGLTTNAGATAGYGISKAAVNALTSKLAAELDGSGVLVNAVCPGLTATAPGMVGARPIPDGARSVVWAAVLPDDGPSGGFIRDGEPVPW